LKMLLLRVALLLLVSALSLGQQGDCPAPTGCDPATNCVLPDCACPKSAPDDVPLEDRPQIVYLSFDDAFSALSEENYYRTLFDGTYKNPNGCPIRATHFVTHQSNDYSLNNKYFGMGHEIASHSITHRSNTTYWRTLPPDGWVDEMVGMKHMIEKYAKLPAGSVIGMRAPYLQGGGDRQFQIFGDNGFKYDCSTPNREFGHTNMPNGIWPYTLDFNRGSMNCQIEPCPTCEYPGIWSQPILDLEDMWLGAEGVPGVGVPCVMLEGCIIPGEQTPELVKDMMMKNFLRAWNGTTRAPIGFYMHAAWFYNGPVPYAGYKLFLDEITTKPEFNDTWIVPIRDGIAYRQDPQPLSVLWNDGFEPFSCDNYVQPEPCTLPINCAYYNVTLDGNFLNEVRMKICDSCPEVYPWLGNPDGIAP